MVKTNAVIDLTNNKKLYVIKDGRLIEHDLPDYGEISVVVLGGKVDRLETTVKTKL
ncbi:DUF3954 domain-containing protein [Sutcliffiella halmapala]|uniref:DUF3954 domain-containing protein n=1 Tax=Sutcliffiella halmapala TaxID=79882 RepID=UPI0009953862|nr:DUF3954 domain-containing protein [Sutcliffiella halmapala]